MSASRTALISFLLIVFTSSVPISLPSGLVKAATGGSAGQTAFFEDNFNGTSIDVSKWNSTFATSGLRWCSDGIPSTTNLTPGTWQDASIVPCNGTIQDPPYGAVSEQGGSATFAASFSRAFPYIWRGQPSRPSAFPGKGDFVLEVKMKYDVITGSGAGFA